MYFSTLVQNLESFGEATFELYIISRYFARSWETTILKTSFQSQISFMKKFKWLAMEILLGKMCD